MVQEASTQAAPAEEGQARPAKRRILIVDDLKDSADSLSILLRTVGHEVETAYDGEEAVAVAERLRPHVILLDLGMPKMNGYETCRRIREQAWGREVFIVALTGWGQKDDLRRTEEAGFDSHMVKPAEPAALKKMLASLPEPRGDHPPVP